jgi:hypothetical protein
MFGTEGYSAVIHPALHALIKTPHTVRAFARSPVEFWIKVISEVHELPEPKLPPCPYVVDPEWREHLHATIELKMPCEIAAETKTIWPDVVQLMRSKGVNPGPLTYVGSNDGDPGMIDAVWCLARHLNARKIVETGVAHGVTSRFLLEALSRNGGGHLWSIDLPPPMHPEVHNQIGIAVTEAQRDNWTLIAGSSRRHLPKLLAANAPIDLFVSDSKHTAYNVLFEMRSAWDALRPGGAIVVDDIDANWGFNNFCASMPSAPAWVCSAEPFAPDPRRVNQKGIFGIVLKS